MKTYDFPCGCKFPILDENIKGNGDGLPSIGIDFNNIPHDCSLTWDLFSSGRTKGVFQLENKLGQDWSAKIQPHNIDELAAVISVIRPGCLKSYLGERNLTQHFADRKVKGEEVTYIHPSLEPILKSTYGILVYQEQAMRLAVDLAGFNLQEADTLRKCVTGDTTFVSKQRGIISIDELLKTHYEDEFLIMDENGVQRWKKIDKIWSTGLHDVNEIETLNGLSVCATRYHQFLTNNGWKARSRLNKEDYLVCPSIIYYDGKDEISEDFAIIIGGLITEGYFVSYNGATFVNHDSSMMKIFEDAMLREFSFKKTTSNKNVFNVSKEIKDKINQILSYGKSDSKYIPTIMMGMTLETTRKFLSFMLAAEGGISEKGQFEYSSKSKKCIKQIQLLLLRFGIRSNLLKTYNKEYETYYYKLYVNDKNEQQKLLKELSILWPEHKIEALIRIINNKKIESFTIDVIPSNIVLRLINQYPNVGKKEGGSIYSQPITRNRFKRLIKSSNDRIWEKFSDGLQSYIPIKNMDKKIRQVETFDFTVSGGDTPYIIANGIVIHNSIGKKLPELMTKVEKMFIEKAKEYKVVPDDIAETVFSWIRESQKYSFNKSHGVGYSELGYWCAYAKAHFPIHFFTSSLYYAKDKQFTQEEIEALVEDAALAGISVCPPTMKHYGGSDISHFYTKDKMIYFGIGDVKKIGQSIANKIKDKILLIEKEIGRKIANWTWYEFLIHFSNEVSSTAINNLIAVGAVDYLDSGMSRARKIFEYNLYKQLGDKEKAYIKYVDAKALGDALEIISKDDRLKITPKNKELVKVLIESFKKETYSTEDTRYSIICAEQELLGIPISCSRTDECSIVGDSMCVDIQFKKGNTSLAVEIINVREHIIKSGTSKGAKMAFLKVKDSSGVLDSVCVFSDKYAEYAALLYKSNTVLLKGQISLKKDVKSFIVNEATQI